MSSPDELTELRAFVAALMSGRDAPATAALPVELVARAHLGPIAYRRGAAAFRDEYAASAIMAVRRAEFLADITAPLLQRGVRVALIKGIAFSGTIYPDPAERPMHDIDLLIPRRQMPEAMRCMATLGLTRVGKVRRRSRYYHAIELGRGDLRIELHRGIVQHYRTAVRMGDVWRRARPDPAAGGLERLDPVDDLLLCLLHIARHELVVPALNYLDVSRLWSRLDPTERDVLRARAAEYRVARAVAAVLSMTELFAAGRSGRPAIRGGGLLPSTDEILTGEPPPRLRQIGQKLLLNDGVRDVLGLGLAYGTVLIDGWWRDRK